MQWCELLSQVWVLSDCPGRTARPLLCEARTYDPSCFTAVQPTVHQVQYLRKLPHGGVHTYPLESIVVIRHPRDSFKRYELRRTGHP